MQTVLLLLSILSLYLHRCRLYSNVFLLFRYPSSSKFISFIQILFCTFFDKVLIVVPFLHACLHLVILSPTFHNVQQSWFETTFMKFCKKKTIIIYLSCSCVCKSSDSQLPLTSSTHFSALVLSRINLGTNTSFSTFLKVLSLGSPEMM